MKKLAIYNHYQANTFVQLDCRVIGVKRNQKGMIGIIFLVDEKFEKAMDRWRNGEFRNNVKG